MSPAGQVGPDLAAPIDPTNRFDLGPTWFWPDMQPELDRLVSELGLERFAQFDTGNMMVERSATEGPLRARGYVNAPASMRLIGGMGALIDRLRQRLDPARVVAGQAVRRLSCADPGVVIESEDATGRETRFRADHVLLALPPRLAEASIAFSPPLPPDVVRQWRMTPTWMASHAKYVAVYETPFWREEGLSGEARSALGPLAEIHDASMPGGDAALFGFLGIPAQVRQRGSEELLRTHCRAQLVRLFGVKARAIRADFLKDWAREPYLATSSDLAATAHEAHAPTPTAASGPWHGCLTGIASEWSPQFPGYLAGAIEAARLGVEALPESAAG